MERGREREGGEREGKKEAPGRHQQFRDCFSDDTLYTHGQQQPTHYGNDTCASIRINILMDTRYSEERATGERERARTSVSGNTYSTAMRVPDVRVGGAGVATGEARATGKKATRRRGAAEDCTYTYNVVSGK